MIDYLNNTSASVVEFKLSTNATNGDNHIDLNYDGVPINYLKTTSSITTMDISSILSILSMSNDGHNDGCNYYNDERNDDSITGNDGGKYRW